MKTDLIDLISDNPNLAAYILLVASGSAGLTVAAMHHAWWAAGPIAIISAIPVVPAVAISGVTLVVWLITGNVFDGNGGYK